MSEAGAEKVIWIQSPSEKLEDPLNMALSKMEGLDGVIVEGNSPADRMTPDLLVFIIGKDWQIKPSAVELSKKADIIIISSKKLPENSPLPDTISLKDKEVFWIDLIKKEGEIDKFLTYVKNTPVK